MLNRFGILILLEFFTYIQYNPTVSLSRTDESLGCRCMIIARLLDLCRLPPTWHHHSKQAISTNATDGPQEERALIICNPLLFNPCWLNFASKRLRSQIFNLSPSLLDAHISWLSGFPKLSVVNRHDT